MIYYVCSPFRGVTPEQVQAHIDYAVALSREMLLQGIVPVTPHLYITMCLNDNDPQERKTGLEAALELLECCDLVVVGQDYGISEGMAAEIKRAKELGKPVFYHRLMPELFHRTPIFYRNHNGRWTDGSGKEL